VRENGRERNGDGAVRLDSTAAISLVKPNGNGGGPHAGPRPRYAGTPSRPKKPLWRNDANDQIIGSSPEVARVRELIALYAQESDPVLICGETGAGKEAVARQLHLLGPRKLFPFVVRNVGRVDRELAGADFFGHARGAFTGAVERRAGLFEQAHGGSLHLDEIAELPLELQANLLRVIEDGVVTPLGPSAPLTVDVRLIAATNVDLAAATSGGGFRKDLFYRLAALTIDLPPLRRRGDDSVEIAEHLIRQISLERGAAYRLTNEAKGAIRRHDWPGNVRELKNALRRAAIHVQDGVIGADHLAIADGRSPGELPAMRAATDLLTRYLTAAALEKEGGVIIAAARLLRMNREKCGEISRKLVGDDADVVRLRADLKRLLGF
jgi:DNA-binding NtrC family response regulator